MTRLILVALVAGLTGCQTVDTVKEQKAKSAAVLASGHCALTPALREGRLEELNKYMTNGNRVLVICGAGGAGG